MFSKLFSPNLDLRSPLAVLETPKNHNFHRFATRLPNRTVFYHHIRLRPQLRFSSIHTLNSTENHTTFLSESPCCSNWSFLWCSVSIPSRIHLFSVFWRKPTLRQKVEKICGNTSQSIYFCLPRVILSALFRVGCTSTYNFVCLISLDRWVLWQIEVGQPRRWSVETRLEHWIWRRSLERWGLCNQSSLIAAKSLHRPIFSQWSRVEEDLSRILQWKHKRNFK